jgi:hypothetical protein
LAAAIEGVAKLPEMLIPAPRLSSRRLVYSDTSLCF